MPSGTSGSGDATSEGPQGAAKENRDGKPSLRKHEVCNWNIGTFTINGSSSPEQLRLFLDIYKEDFRERAKGGKPLTKEDEELAEKLAREIIEKEGKQVFVVTRKTSKIVETESGGKKAVDVHVPIGFTIFWVKLAGHMESSDMVYHTDRLFISENMRRMGLGTEMILRNWAKAYRECPSLAYASFHDPFHFCTGYVLESMKSKGLVSQVQRRMYDNDYFVQLKPEALPDETVLFSAEESPKPAKAKRKG